MLASARQRAKRITFGSAPGREFPSHPAVAADTRNRLRRSGLTSHPFAENVSASVNGNRRLRGSN